MLAERFGAQVVAAGTIEQMRLHVSIREVFWDRLWPGQIPPSPVTTVTVPNHHFILEGHEFVIVEVGHSDADESSVLHVPDLGLGELLRPYRSADAWLRWVRLTPLPFFSSYMSASAFSSKTSSGSCSLKSQIRVPTLSDN